MKILIYIFFIIIISISLPEISFSESKLAEKIWGNNDCSQYSTKTFKGLNDYTRCKKGLKVDDKSFFNLKWLQGKKKEFNPNKSCDEYSSKTITGLAAKIKCKRAKKN